MSLNLDYFYGSEGEQYCFFRIPKTLFTNPHFKSVTVEAKVLYGLLLDRMSLSVKNGWLDAEGRVFIFFTLKDAMAQMNCGKDKILKLFNELDATTGIGLIERKKQGFGRPMRIYVKNFLLPEESEQPAGDGQPAAPSMRQHTSPPVNVRPETRQKSAPASAGLQEQDTPDPAPIAADQRTPAMAGPSRQPPLPDSVWALRDSEKPRSAPLPCAGTQTSEIPKSGLLEIRSLDFGKTDPNNTENIKTDISNTDPSFHPSPFRTGAHTRTTGLPPGMDEMDGCREQIRENIDYDALIFDHPEAAEIVDGYVEQITEVCCSRKPFVKVGGNSVSIREVRDRLMELTKEHIEYVMDCMEKTVTLVHNPRAYTLTALYNAPTTMDQYYLNLYRHDMAMGRI